MIFLPFERVVGSDFSMIDQISRLWYRVRGGKKNGGWKIRREPANASPRSVRNFTRGERKERGKERRSSWIWRLCAEVYARHVLIGRREKVVKSVTRGRSNDFSPSFSDRRSFVFSFHFFFSYPKRATLERGGEWERERR